MSAAKKQGSKDEIIELPSRLNQADFDLFIPALRNVQAATQTYQTLQQQLAQAQANYNAAQGALHYVVKHLAPQYHMAEHDEINEDGIIIRKSK